MTDREKAIVMAYTGVCMLQGDEFNIFHKYVEEVIGRPVYTHELGELREKIREASKEDFLKLCKEDTGKEEHMEKWIPVSERLPEDNTRVLVTVKVENREPKVRSGYYYMDGHFHIDNGDCWESRDKELLAWMPLPKPY